MSPITAESRSGTFENDSRPSRAKRALRRRLYFDTPAAFELALPVNLDQSGWGRSLHFMAAWICVINGSVYAAWGDTRNKITEPVNALDPISGQTHSEEDVFFQKVKAQ